MCFAATGRLQRWAAKLLLVRRKSWCNEYLVQICLAANGPAIKGGCVSWRSHPATGPSTLAGKLSRWQARYGVLFAIMVQILLSAGAIVVQGF